MYCRLYNLQCKNFKKRIASSTARNVKFFETHCGLYNLQFIFEIILNCGLYNPQCVSKFFTLRVVEPVMCFKIFTLWIVDKRHFDLFIISKMEILELQEVVMEVQEESLMVVILRGKERRFEVRFVVLFIVDFFFLLTFYRSMFNFYFFILINFFLNFITNFFWIGVRINEKEEEKRVRLSELKKIKNK